MGLFGRRRGSEKRAEELLQRSLGPDVVIYWQVAVVFRVNMGRTPTAWRDGFAAITSQGLSVWEPDGGLFTKDWGTIRYLDVPATSSLTMWSAVGFDGGLIQAEVGSGQREFTLNAMAAWASLRPAQVERGGARIEFSPGAWQLPAMLNNVGEWSGGPAQVRATVHEWATEVSADLSAETILRTRKPLMPPEGDVEKALFWDACARRVVQSELGLLDSQMRDVTFSSTLGAVLYNGTNRLYPVWLSVTNQSELWLIYLPGLALGCRPSLGLQQIALSPAPGQRSLLSSDLRDLQPASLARFDLSRIGRLSVLPDQDGRSVVIFFLDDDDQAVIDSSTDLPSDVVLSIDGGLGWEGVQAALEANRG